MRLQVELTEMPVEPTADVHLAAAGNSTWKTAQPINPDTTVYAAADDRPYIPSVGSAQETFAQMLDGVHWYRFDYPGPGEQLLHINLDILDRDVPVDVALSRSETASRSSTPEVSSASRPKNQPCSTGSTNSSRASSSPAPTTCA